MRFIGIYLRFYLFFNKDIINLKVDSIVSIYDKVCNISCFFNKKASTGQKFYILYKIVCKLND